jgi:hypothetical protein
MFRAEVRRDIERPRPRGTLAKLAHFLESKLGFWLLTTVLTSAAVTGYTSLQNHFERERLALEAKAEQERVALQLAAESARRDTDMLLRLGPMLGSERPEQARFAILLLNGLTDSNAVNPAVAAQVKSLFEDLLRAGTDRNASPEQRSTAETLISIVEPSRAAAVAAAMPSTTTVAPETALAQIAMSDLPVRVYIQYPDDRLKPLAESAQFAYRRAGMVAPGIERVPPTSAPATRAQVRYCPGKADADEIERVRETTASALGAAPEMLELAERLCGRVRHNHFELWLARG